jgi:hypothetical protein
MRRSSVHVLYLQSNRLNLNTNHTVDPSKGRPKNACIICSTTGLASLGHLYLSWAFQNTLPALALAS